MKSFAAATLLAVLASAVSAQDSSGCDENYSGTFEIAPYNITQSIPAQGETVCNTNPIVTLKNGVLTDQDDRTGEVVANHQFQFDNPVQGPTTSGFCIYTNGSLALNGNAIFYGCLSGSFSNLYDISIGAQCHEIYIVTFPCAGSSSSVIASSSSTTSTTSSTSTTPTPTTTSTSSTPTTTSTTSTSSTPVAVPATSSTPVVLPSTSTAVSSVPFPVGNSTTSASSASSASVATFASSSSTSSSTTSSTSATPTTFKGAASIVAVGGKVVAVIAGIAAFALF